MTQLAIVDALPSGMCYSDRIPTPDEVRAVLDGLQHRPDMFLLTAALVATGAPISCLLQTKRSDIKGGRMQINHASNSGQIVTRTVPVSSGLQVGLTNHCCFRRIEYSHYVWSNPRTGKPIARSPYLRAVGMACKNAGMEWIPIKSYIRLIICLGLLLDIPLQQLANHVGYSDWNVIKNSGKVTPDEMKSLELWCDTSPAYWFPWFLQLNYRTLNNDQYIADTCGIRVSMQ